MTNCRVESGNNDSLEEKNIQFDLYLVPTTEVNSNLNIYIKLRKGKVGK